MFSSELVQNFSSASVFIWCPHMDSNSPPTSWTSPKGQMVHGPESLPPLHAWLVFTCSPTTAELSVWQLGNFPGSHAIPPTNAMFPSACWLALLLVCAPRSWVLGALLCVWSWVDQHQGRRSKMCRTVCVSSGCAASHDFGTVTPAGWHLKQFTRSYSTDNCLIKNTSKNSWRLYNCAHTSMQNLTIFLLVLWIVFCKAISSIWENTLLLFQQLL